MATISLYQRVTDVMNKFKTGGVQSRTHTQSAGRPFKLKRKPWLSNIERAQVIPPRMFSEVTACEIFRFANWRR